MWTYGRVSRLRSSGARAPVKTILGGRRARFYGTAAAGWSASGSIPVGNGRGRVTPGTLRAYSALGWSWPMR